MKKSLLARTASATAASLISTSVALASEGPEGLGDMQGVKPLLYLLGGVAALGVVLYAMIKFLGRK